MDIEELINRGQQGDQKALCSLYNAYSHKMLAKCVNLVGNHMVAEELTHDAFILAFSKLNQLQNPKRFEKWLATIVANIAFRYLEQNKKHNTISLSELNENELPLHNSQPLETEQNKVLDISDILSAVENLPNGYKNVFKMSILQGLSHNEIADILGIKERSSASQLTRAKKLLRQHLSKFLFVLSVILITPIIYIISKQRIEDKSAQPIISQNDKTPKESAQLPDTSTHITHSPIIKAQATSSKQIITNQYIAKKTITVFDSTIFTSVDSTNYVAQQNTPIDSTVIDSIKPNHSPNKNIAVIDTTSFDFSIPTKLSKADWGITLAYSNNITPFYPHSNAIIEDLTNGGTFPDGIIHIKDFNELKTWQEAIDYANYANIPEGEKDAITQIANSYISRKQNKISRSQNHHLPFSVAIAVNRHINQRFSIESGLSYSKLSSEFITGKENAGSICNQDIHYLGIPLKLSYNWLETSHWGIYSSVGIMMDIPIQAKQKTDYILYESNLYHKSQHINAPLQWSTGLGIGLQYKFTPNIGLFAEPNIYYYIPNGSDIETYRTKHRFSISLPIGIKFTW